MNRFLIRLLINGIALYLAVVIVPGIGVENSSPVTYLWLALIFGILNALLKPILKFLTCPLILLTLGLFTLQHRLVLPYGLVRQTIRAWF